jgi:hypothetical protein
MEKALLSHQQAGELWRLARPEKVLSAYFKIALGT